MENQTQTTQTQTGNPELSVTDLQNLHAVIDVAVRRGAFSASEMSAVGSVYDRVSAFLNAVAPKKDQEQQAAE